MIILCVKVLVHLSPEHLACAGIVSVIERAAIAQPVVDVIGNRLMVNPALGVEFLIVSNGVIELRPNAYHEAAVHLMNVVEHLLRVRIARSLEGVVAPGVEFPVVPVLHDIVNRNMALAELSQSLLNLCLRLVSLAALPETEHPLRINRSLARQGAIA